MLRRLVLGALLAGATAGSAVSETYVERSLSNTPWGFVKISSPVRAGRVAQMFELRPGDCASDGFHDDCTTDRERTEVWLPQDQWHQGDVRWIGYSIMLPPDFQPSDPVIVTAGQVHMQGGPTDAAGGSPGVLLMSLDQNGYTACIIYQDGPRVGVTQRCEHIHLASLDQMRGRWMDVQIGLDLATPGGVVEIWANGRKVGQMSGFHRHYGDRYYFKYGVYRSFVSRHDETLPTQTLFYDEVRIGQTREEVVVDEAQPVD